MPHPFPAIRPQHQIDAPTRALPSRPSLPWGEWLLALAALLVLLRG